MCVCALLQGPRSPKLPISEATTQPWAPNCTHKQTTDFWLEDSGFKSFGGGFYNLRALKSSSSLRSRVGVSDIGVRITTTTNHSLQRNYAILHTHTHTHAHREVVLMGFKVPLVWVRRCMCLGIWRFGPATFRRFCAPDSPPEFRFLEKNHRLGFFRFLMGASASCSASGCLVRILNLLFFGHRLILAAFCYNACCRGASVGEETGVSLGFIPSEMTSSN